MLIRSLYVKIRRPAELIPCFEHCGMGGTGIEPHIHDVLLFGKRPALAVRTGVSLREDFLGAPDPPGIGAFACKELFNHLQGHVINHLSAAFLAVEDGEGNSPSPLTGYAPV